MLSNIAQSMLSAAFSIGWLFSGYLIFSIIFIFIKILSRLKNEVFNERLKIKPRSDHVILITGATSGIGLALAKYFFRRGFSIIATRLSENEPDHLTELMSEEQRVSRGQVPTEEKPRIFFVNLDVRFHESISDSYNEVKKILKENNLKLYALINNAGIAFNYYAHWALRSQLTSIIQVNVTGPMLMVRQYTPLLAKTPGSRIVNLGSILGQIVSPSAAYNTTKAALAMFSNCSAQELQHLKIKSIVVYVGNLMKNTSIVKHSSANVEQVYAEFTEEERLLYDKGFRKHAENLKENDRFIEKHQLSNISGGKQNKSSPLSSIMRLLNYSGGTLSNNNLVDTYLMKSFDNAICLKNPPNELYGGNWYYSIVTSSLIESFSTKTFKDFCNFSSAGHKWQA